MDSPIFKSPITNAGMLIIFVTSSLTGYLGSSVSSSSFQCCARWHSIVAASPVSKPDCVTIGFKNLWLAHSPILWIMPSCKLQRCIRESLSGIASPLPKGGQRGGEPPHSKTLAHGSTVGIHAKRLGVFQSSGALSTNNILRQWLDSASIPSPTYSVHKSTSECPFSRRMDTVPVDKDLSLKDFIPKSS